MTSVDAETVVAEWGTLYRSNRGSKDHIMRECSYVTDHHRPVATDALPPDHVDLCAWCAQRFANWRGGITTDSSSCARCGAGIESGTYCGDCRATIDRRRARR